MPTFTQLNAMAATLEPAKYVVMCKDGVTPKFFEIAFVKGGNRLFEIKGNPGNYVRETCTYKVQAYVLWCLTSAPKKHIALYGQHAKFCGACDSPLTHARSLACGMGPKCAPKWGVKW